MDIAEHGAEAPEKQGIGEYLVREAVADKGPHHPERDLFVAQPVQRANVAGGHHRHLFGHVKPAVARQPGQHRLFECQRRGTAPGRDVLHVSCLSFADRWRQISAPVITAQTRASENQVIAYCR